MTAGPPSRALFEHSYPEELLLAVERGAGGVPLELDAGDPVAAARRLDAACAGTADPLVLELVVARELSEAEAQALAASLLDAVEHGLSRSARSPREELRWRSTQEALLRALVRTMRLRYVGDPPPAED